ncbi:MAG: response regulator transcription factor [Polyangiaceae bacterium]|nr:response regulator transcription factor [Myxococcales bacterium]MCB9583921.1 response regulator transcription factor [Polyangiaceae bacterium]MCB9607823.1 response regulator transcription factor [Polyangiaceae bacterium]
MIRVFVADDHPLVRHGVVEVLRSTQGIEIVGEADDGLRLLNAPTLAEADVLVLDLSLPRMSGSEVLRRLRVSRPSLAVVILSSHPEDQFADRALADGAAFYVSKEKPPSVLVQAIRDAADGRRASRTPTPPGNRREARQKLSRREHQVLTLVVSGRSVAEIAAELDVQSCTVSNHLAKVRDKLGLQTAADMVKYAYSVGILVSPPDAGEPVRED